MYKPCNTLRKKGYLSILRLYQNWWNSLTQNLKETFKFTTETLKHINVYTWFNTFKYWSKIKKKQFCLCKHQYSLWQKNMNTWPSPNNDTNLPWQQTIGCLLVTIATTAAIFRIYYISIMFITKYILTWTQITTKSRPSIYIYKK